MTKQQIVKDLAELSHINFDIENIIQEADYLGEMPRHLAQELADHLAFQWNRMTRDDKGFNETQDRLENLYKFIGKDIRDNTVVYELDNGNCYDCEPEKDRCRYCGTDIAPGDGVCDTCYEKELTR